MSEIFKIFEHKPTRIHAAKYRGENTEFFKKEFPECPMHLFDDLIGLWIVRQEGEDDHGIWSKWSDEDFKKTFNEVQDE